MKKTKISGDTVNILLHALLGLILLTVILAQYSAENTRPLFGLLAVAIILSNVINQRR